MQEQTHPDLYPLAGLDLHLTYSNQAVQIRVLILELADLLASSSEQVLSDLSLATTQPAEDLQNSPMP